MFLLNTLYAFYQITVCLNTANQLVTNKQMVYSCVVRWLEAQRKVLASRSEVNIEEEMEMMVQQVMAYVRFPMMTPRQLAELLLSPLTKQYKEFFIERMAIGMSYHSGKILLF